MSSKEVSPSTIDCICCSLGAIALLWISTLATALIDEGDVDGIVDARFTLIYNGSPFDSTLLASPEREAPSIERWRLDNRPLAEFRLDKTIVPKLEMWPSFMANGSEGRCSFGPEDEEASESVRFVSLAPREKENGQFAWTRVISVQQRRKGESVVVEIEFYGKQPVEAEVSVTMDGKTLTNRNEATFVLSTPRLQVVADGETATIRTPGENR